MELAVLVGGVVLVPAISAEFDVGELVSDTQDREHRRGGLVGRLDRRIVRTSPGAVTVEDRLHSSQKPSSSGLSTWRESTMASTPP